MVVKEPCRVCGEGGKAYSTMSKAHLARIIHRHHEKEVRLKTLLRMCVNNNQLYTKQNYELSVTLGTKDTIIQARNRDLLYLVDLVRAWMTESAKDGFPTVEEIKKKIETGEYDKPFVWPEAPKDTMGALNPTRCSMLAEASHPPVDNGEGKTSHAPVSGLEPQEVHLKLDDRIVHGITLHVEGVRGAPVPDDTCPKCKGDGKVPYSFVCGPSGDDNDIDFEDCPDCKGTGKVQEEKK